MSEGMEIFLGLLFGLYVLVAPGLGAAAFFRLKTLQRRLEEALAGMRRLDDEHLELARQLARPGGGKAPAAAPTAQAEPSAVPSVPPTPWAQPEAPEVPPLPPPPPAELAPAPPAGPGFEEQLTSRWLVWIGGGTLALAAAFLVKYSIDQGLLSPAVRVILGALLGVGLVGAGEWLRNRPLAVAVASVRPDAVPPALAAAGLFALFASVYAAYELYALIGPLPAFALLALVAAAAGALALWHGPFVALLGIIGGYVTPMLVATQEPSAWGLFPYLLALTGGALAVVRVIGAAWLGWAALAGAAFWPLQWMAVAWSPNDLGPVAGYLLLLAGQFLFLLRAPGAASAVVTLREGLGPLSAADRVAMVGALVVAGLLFALVRMDLYGPGGLIAAGLLIAFYLGFARREPAFDVLAPAAASLALILLATWHLPELITRTAPLISIMGVTEGRVPGPLLPPELLPFAVVAGAFSALVAGGGFVALWGAVRPGLFAWTSALTPVLALAIGYWRILAFGLDLRWTLAALALAGLAVVAAERTLRYAEEPGFAEVAAAYAAAVVAALSLGAAMALEEAWLTVALALELPALAWLHSRLGANSLRVLATIVAGIVLIRLAFNPRVLDYPLGETPLLNWLLYGYGVPAAAFAYAARSFRAGRDDRLVALLEAGALAFVTLFVFFELRSLVGERLDARRYGLFEQSLQTMAWLALGYGLARVPALAARPVLTWGGRILATLAATQVLLGHLLAQNPLFSGERVGPWPVLDLLLLAYLAPAGFALLFARAFQRAGLAGAARTAAIAAYVLVFVWVSLETRHLFVGEVLSRAPVSDGELYAYSAVWLGYAGVLLAFGLRTGYASLRYAALALLIVTVAKVFLVDMEELRDLWRVASFLGLGGPLIGIGYLYRRYVFPARAGSTAQS